MRPVLLVVAAAVCFGTTGTAQELGPDAASSSAVGLTRIVAGGLLLGALAWTVAARRGPDAPAAAIRPHAISVLVGGVAVLAYQPLFFAGAASNGVAVAAVVALGSAPVLTGLLEWIVTRRAPGRRWLAGTSCAVVGVALISGLLDGTSDDVGAAGIVASLGAALSYAVYTLGAKRMLVAGCTPISTVGAMFAAAAVMGAPLLLLVDLDWAASRPGVGMIAWLAVATVVIAYVLFAAGLRSLAASTVSTLTLLEPLTACLLGVVLLDERLSVAGWCGLVVLLASVAALGRPARSAGIPAGR